ncbi:MAG: succinyl-diaminopimelate desuccinylase [Pseudomonadota bacterium]
MTVDPVELTAALVRCPSVTPDAGDALALLDDVLSAGGFRTTRVDRGGVPNLFAIAGEGPAFGFNGHVDVVPTGDPALWSAPPFGAEIRGDRMIGRGTVDMKSGVAAFVAAAVAHVALSGTQHAIALAITGDEEGSARDGTQALLDWMRDTGHSMRTCIVGEPTGRSRVGDTIKIGRRGSISARIRAEGTQGHVAYPTEALNPLTGLVRFLDRVASAELDQGTADFDPSTLAITTVDTGNTAGNVIPAAATAALNIRFNDAQTGDGLAAWLQATAARVSEETGVTLDLETTQSADSFVTAPGPFPTFVAETVEEMTGVRPDRSTSGGTSDARFVTHHCAVVELGLVGQGMHAVDESVDVRDIRTLTNVYARLLQRSAGMPLT